MSTRRIRHESVTIRHKLVTDSTLKTVNSGSFSAKTPNPSQIRHMGFVTDFGGDKSFIYNKIYIFFSININPSHVCPRGACAYARGGGWFFVTDFPALS